MLAVVQDGWRVVEVVRRGVSRQSVHTWIARYERGSAAAAYSKPPGSTPNVVISAVSLD